MFPRPPVRKTSVVTPPDEDDNENTVQQWREYYQKIRNYLLRQTFQESPGVVSEETKKFRTLSFDEFLYELGLSEKQYMDGLKMMVKSRGNQVLVKRDCKDVFCNNYNPKLLLLHRANLDVSPITNEYACAAYVLGYLTKAEAGLSKLLKSLDEDAEKYGLSTDERLKKFANALDNSREVSIQEICYRTLGLGMCVGSRVVKFINVNKPEERDGLLKGSLDSLGNDESPFMNSPIDYYQARPEELEELSLADFVAKYDIVYSSKKSDLCNEDLVDDDNIEESDSCGNCNIISLLNGMGNIRQRGFDAVIRYHINKRDETEMKRNMLLLFHPFRDEERDIHSHETENIDELFFNNYASIEEQRKIYEPHRDLLITLDECIKDIQDDEDEDLDEDEEKYEEDETTGKDDIKDFVKQAIAAKSSSESNQVEYLTPLTEIRGWVKSLNFDQRRIFDDVIERMCSSEVDKDPFYLYIAGEAGTGKSFLMKTIIEASKHAAIKSGTPLDRSPALVLCPTANSANIVGGETIESAMKMFRGNSLDTPIMNYSVEGTLAYKYEYLETIFIEEVSMVGGRKAHGINSRIEQLKGKKKFPFSSTSVIATGDFHQLPPVNDCYAFMNVNVDGRPANLAPNIWKQYFKIYKLTEKMRCLDDPDFASICDSVGEGTITKPIVSYFEEKVGRSDDECFHNNELYKSGHVAIIVADNAKVDQINTAKLAELLPDEEEIIFRAEDKIKNVDNIQPRLEGIPYTKTGAMRTTLTVKENAPVLITKNLDKSDFLTNGQRGFIVSINVEDSIIWVEFPEEKIGQKRRNKFKKKLEGHPHAVPILKDKSSFSWGKKGSVIRIQRTQFPLILSYAMTAHKSQGMTISKVLVDFTNTKGDTVNLPAGSFYVAITRVRKGSDLYLSRFSPGFIKANKVVEEELKRMMKRARYGFHKKYLHDEVFVSKSGEKVHEVKISYLNINGLLASEHLADLSHDKNLLNSDFLCVAETKVEEIVNDEHIMIPSFDIIARLDSLPNSQSRGMVLYMKKDCGHAVPDVITDRRKHTETIEAVIADMKVCFVYIHPNALKKDVDSLQNVFRPSDLVMGDLNINTMDERGTGSKRLSKIADEAFKQSVLKEPTHQRFSQPDHILLQKYFFNKFLASTYKNLYSDHNSITFRTTNMRDAELIQGAKNEDNDKKNNEQYSNKRTNKETVNSQSNSDAKFNTTLLIESSGETDDDDDHDLVVFDEISRMKLFERDILELDGTNWLRGNVIDLYLILCTRDKTDQYSLPWNFFTQFSQEDKNIGYSKIKNLTRNMDIFSLKLLLIPIYVTNHWILATVEDLGCPIINVKLYDPKYNDRYSFVLKEVQCFLEMEYLAKRGISLTSVINLTMEGTHIPVQYNDHDCGVFLCQFGKCLSLNLPLDFVESDMPVMRKAMKAELKHKLVEKKLLKAAPIRPTKSSRLSTTKAFGEKISFQNKSGDLCWLNSLLQLVIRALQITGERDFNDDLWKLINDLQTTRIPKVGFNAANIRELISKGQFQDMISGQQCVVEGLQCMFHQSEDIASLFTFLINMTTTCGTCATSRDVNSDKNYVDIQLPKIGRKSLFDSETVKTLIEDYFDKPVYKPDIIGCEIHQEPGALVTEVLLTIPDFLLVVINRIETVRDEEGGVRYWTRKEECQIPNSIKITTPHGNQMYELFAVINWDGVVSSTGRTQGHYTANIKFGNKWFHTNDKIIKEIPRQYSKCAYVLGYTKYEA